MKRQKVSRLALFACFCVLTLACISILESFYERFQASELIAALSEIRVGYTTKDQVRQITRPFSFFRDHNDDKAESEAISSDSYTFRNRAFAFFHLAPATFVWASIEFKNNVAVRKSAQYYEAPRCSGSVTESVKYDEPLVSNEDVDRSGRHIYVSSSTPSPVFIMKVRDDLTVPLTRRQLDWQIDLACMTTIGGCRDPRKVLRGALLQIHGE